MRQPSRFSEVGFESMKMGVFLLFGRTKRPDLPASVFRRFPLAARLAEFGRLAIPAGRCANSRSGRRIPDKHA
jgi:hypothetical protein